MKVFIKEYLWYPLLVRMALMLLVVLLLIFLAIHQTFFQPTKQKHESYTLKLSELRRRIVELRGQKENYTQLQLIQEVLDEKYNQYLTPINSNIISREISESIANNSLTLIDEQYEPIRKLKDLQVLSVRIRVTGGYEGLKKFIEDFNRISALSFPARVDFSNEDGDILAVIDLDVYAIGANDE